MMRTITVKGVGNVSAKPDYISISMTIESVENDYDKVVLSIIVDTISQKIYKPASIYYSTYSLR